MKNDDSLVAEINKLRYSSRNPVQRGTELLGTYFLVVCCSVLNNERETLVNKIMRSIAKKLRRTRVKIT